MEVKTMNCRAVFLSAFLAAGVSLTIVSHAVADPLPSAGVWDDSVDHKRNDQNYYRAHRGYGDPHYSQIVDRIDNDRLKIAEIESTGRNHEALQWYKNDLRSAERAMRSFRDDMETMPGRRGVSGWLLLTPPVSAHAVTYSEPGEGQRISRALDADQRLRTEEANEESLDRDRRSVRAQSDAANRYYWWWPFRR